MNLFNFLQQDLSNGKTLKISCDESQDGDPIDNYLVVGGRAGPYLWEVRWPTAEARNAVNIESNLQVVIYDLESKTGKTVCLFISIYSYFIFSL